MSASVSFQRNLKREEKLPNRKSPHFVLDDWRFQMQMISSRTIPFLDAQSLAAGEAREVLIRDDTGRFILYLSDGDPPLTVKERVIILGPREALIWLNETSQDQGSFWE
jgi:hypothetical protein